MPKNERLGSGCDPVPVPHSVVHARAEFWQTGRRERSSRGRDQSGECTRDDEQATFDRQSSLAPTHSASLCPSNSNKPNDRVSQHGGAPKSQARSLRSLTKIKKIFRESRHPIRGFERQTQRDTRKSTEKAEMTARYLTADDLGKIDIFERVIPPSGVRLPIVLRGTANAV